jgi:hypothetical protein
LPLPPSWTKLARWAVPTLTVAMVGVSRANAAELKDEKDGATLARDAE